MVSGREQPPMPIYMDHHATTPLDERVLEAMMPYLTTKFGNAASTDHLFGVEAKRAVDRARSQVADIIGARPREIVFTSGATESDNLAIFGIARGMENRGRHIVTCVTEHPAVLDPVRHLRQLGWDITELPVDHHGLVDPADVRRAIRADTVLVSIMTANNEVGTIAPIAEIGAIAREADVLFHTDAAQAVGHVPVNVSDMTIDLLSLSAHKCYGPKGIGALYAGRRARRYTAPIIFGGGHERGLRSGTLNVPGVVGLGEALNIAAHGMLPEGERLRGLTQHMLNQLTEAVSAELNGHPDQRLPHNLNVHIPGVDAKLVIQSLDGIAISSGSACATTSTEPSHVLLALGCSAERAIQSIRIGLGRSNTKSDADVVAERIVAATGRLRAFAA